MCDPLRAVDVSPFHSFTVKVIQHTLKSLFTWEIKSKFIIGLLNFLMLLFLLLFSLP